MNVPVALYVKLAVLVLKAVGRGELIYIPEKCLICGGLLECEIVFESGGVQLLYESGVNEE